MLEKLVAANGWPSFGVIPGGVGEVNYLDFDLRSPMDRPLGRRARRRRFNQFEFVSLCSPGLIVGVAIVDLRLVSNAFAYIFDPVSGAFDEFSFLQPLARKTQIEPFPHSGRASFRKGDNCFEITACAARGQRHVSLHLDGLVLEASLDEGAGYTPLALCTRAGYNGWVYTQKAAALPVTGRLNWRGRELDLGDLGMLAGVDWTGGYMRRETFWNWASLSCYLPDGRRLGMNLAAGVNETGFTENALWLDGQMIKVDGVSFDFDRYRAGSEWRIRSSDGVVDLQFRPQGKRCEKTNAWLIASNFTQHFGLYQGSLRLPGEVLDLRDCWGLAEDHYARW